MLSMVQAYSLISTGVRFTASHIATQGRQQPRLLHRGAAVDQKDLITNVYGSKQSQQLERHSTAQLQGIALIR